LIQYCIILKLFPGHICGFYEIYCKELELVKKLAKVTEERNLYGTEKELFRKPRRK